MSPLDVDELVAAGLYDPGAPDAVEQLNLLRLLEARGGTIEQMVRANEAGRLSRLAAELLVVSEPDRYTAAEVAARAGVGVDRFIELWRAAGFADPAADDARFTEAEVELVRTFEAAAGLFGEAATIQLLRVVGASVSRVADAAVSTFITTLGASAMAADPVTGALAEANLAATALFPQLSAAMDGLLRHHLVEAARPNVTGVSSGFETVTATGGFVDVVGSTGLATHLPLGDIGRAIASFEEHAANAVAASGGRVVKFIGDELMFRVHDPAAACHVALTIVARFSDDEVLPGARRGGLRRPPRTRRRLLRPGGQRRGACDEAGPAGDRAHDRVRAGRRAGGRRAAVRGRAAAAAEGLRQPRHAVRRRGGLTCLFALSQDSTETSTWAEPCSTSSPWPRACLPSRGSSAFAWGSAATTCLPRRNWTATGA